VFHLLFSKVLLAALAAARRSRRTLARGGEELPADAGGVADLKMHTSVLPARRGNDLNHSSVLCARRFRVPPRQVGTCATQLSLPYNRLVMNSNAYSTFLFASPSFLEGVGRVVDLGGFLTEYNYSPSPDAADAIALASDWAAIGMDMRTAIRKRAEMAHAQEGQGPAANR
jgi:hypothetical protein